MPRGRSIPPIAALGTPTEKVVTEHESLDRRMAAAEQCSSSSLKALGRRGGPGKSTMKRANPIGLPIQMGGQGVRSAALHGLDLAGQSALEEKRPEVWRTASGRGVAEGKTNGSGSYFQGPPLSPDRHPQENRVSPSAEQHARHAPEIPRQDPAGKPLCLLLCRRPPIIPARLPDRNRSHPRQDVSRGRTAVAHHPMMPFVFLDPQLPRIPP